MVVAPSRPTAVGFKYLTVAKSGLRDTASEEVGDSEKSYGSRVTCGRVPSPI
jgi:hypothetical protein